MTAESASAIATARATSTGTLEALTPAERLRRLDPDLADRMDAFAATLDREYDLAVNENPAPPALDGQTAWGMEGWRLNDTIRPMLELADDLCAARDEAYMVLGRVEQLIAQRTLEAVQLTPQPALDPPPPSDPYDGGEATEDFHRLHPPGGTAELPKVEPAPDWYLPASQHSTPPTLATLVGGWWRRLRDHTRRVWAEVTVGMATWIPWGVG